jgi:hypothetical protein
LTFYISEGFFLFLLTELNGERAGASVVAKRQGYRVGHAGYVSEFEQFMDKFLGEHPEVVEDQRRGWYIFWNRKVDFEELNKASEDSVPTKGYDYF